MSKLIQTIKVNDERGFSRLEINEGDDFGTLFCWDCGWEYSAEHFLDEIASKLESGYWEVVDGS